MHHILERYFRLPVLPVPSRSRSDIVVEEFRGGQQQQQQQQQQVGISLVCMYKNVREEMTRRMRSVSERLDGSVMGATQVVSGKIHDIAREASGECDIPDKESTSRLYMPVKRLDYLLKIRKEKPELYKTMAGFAKRYVAPVEKDDESRDMTKEALTFADTLLKAS